MTGQLSQMPREPRVPAVLLEATLDALAIGVYLTGRRAHVVYMNRAAEHQLETGNVLRVVNNRLSPLNHGARAAMAKAIADVAAGASPSRSGGITLALPDDDRVGLVATILALGRGGRHSLSGPFAATAAVFVQDPVLVPLYPGEAFARLYGLTGGELRVLLAMAPGIAVKQAADTLGISETTAKTHLQRLYSKTNTSKQTELMNLLRASTPPISASA